jgi:TatD DNase family protein
MVDTHCHLDACEEPVTELVENAREAGVDRMLAIGMDPGSVRHALSAADDFPEVFASVGLHPHESERFDDDLLAELALLVEHPKVRAIGETGLDHKRDYAPRDAQRRSFIAQMELARESRLPLVIHTREAADDTLALLDQHAAGLEVIIHCFSLAERLGECVERGYYCSFAGNVTYPKATDLHDAAAKVPEELILAETDAPFLSAQERRGKPNQPAYVGAAARFLAELRGTPSDAMEAILDANAARLFRW